MALVEQMKSSHLLLLSQVLFIKLGQLSVDSKQQQRQLVCASGHKKAKVILFLSSSSSSTSCSPFVFHHFDCVRNDAGLGLCQAQETRLKTKQKKESERIGFFVVSTSVVVVVVASVVQVRLCLPHCL